MKTPGVKLTDPGRFFTVCSLDTEDGGRRGMLDLIKDIYKGLPVDSQRIDRQAFSLKGRTAWIMM